MPVDISFLERLVPACDAIEVIAQEHERRGTYDSFQTGRRELCQTAAIETVLVRLVSGSLKAWSMNCFIDSTRDTGLILGTENKIIATGDFHYSEMPAEIPVEFWWHFQNAGKGSRKFDLVSGDVLFDYLDSDYSNRHGSACGVYFDPRGLPVVAPFTYVTSNAPLDAPTPMSTSKGRKPANWWPDFAEELAIDLHDNGWPETQDALINRVFSSMAEQGKPEPSRTTVQPVIRALYARRAKAGK